VQPHIAYCIFYLTQYIEFDVFSGLLHSLTRLSGPLEARRITDLDELKQQLRTERAKLDHVVIAAAIRQWRRQ